MQLKLRLLQILELPLSLEAESLELGWNRTCAGDVPAGRRSAFQRHAPANTTEVVLEAGHCPHDEVPEQVNRALLEWLSGIAAD